MEAAYVLRVKRRRPSDAGADLLLLEHAALAPPGKAPRHENTPPSAEAVFSALTLSAPAAAPAPPPPPAPRAPPV